MKKQKEKYRIRDEKQENGEIKYFIEYRKWTLFGYRWKTAGVKEGFGRWSTTDKKLAESWLKGFKKGRATNY